MTNVNEQFVRSHFENWLIQSNKGFKSEHFFRRDDGAYIDSQLNGRLYDFAAGFASRKESPAVDAREQEVLIRDAFEAEILDGEPADSHLRLRYGRSYKDYYVDVAWGTWEAAWTAALAHAAPATGKVGAELYLQLTEAMGYDSGKDGMEFSPEEWAAALLKDATAYRATLAPTLQAETGEAAIKALRIAEAALADIGDADREPGDDLAWCERRAAQALPEVRAALTAVQADTKGGVE